MKTVMKSLHGSTLYGTATPESDKDFKGIYIPGGRDIILGTDVGHFTRNTSSHHQKNTADDVDEEMFSLQYFLKLACKGETIALDMIHTPRDMVVEMGNQQVWNFIRQNRYRFYTTDMKAYLGYVKKQAAKYGIKGTRMAALRQVWDAIKDLETEYYITPDQALREVDFPREKHINCRRFYKVADVVSQLPINDYCKISVCSKTGNKFYDVMGVKHQLTIKLSELKQKVSTEWEKYGERARQAERNEGIDWKAMHHAIRGGLQLKEIYATGDLKYPLVDREELIQIKKGEISFKTVSEFLEDIISDVDRLAAEASKNGMPSKVDTKFWDDFVHDTYMSEIVEYRGTMC